MKLQRGDISKGLQQVVEGQVLHKKLSDKKDPFMTKYRVFQTEESSYYLVQ
jgi:hypothetical protein